MVIKVEKKIIYTFLSVYVPTASHTKTVSLNESFKDHAISGYCFVSFFNLFFYSLTQTEHLKQAYLTQVKVNKEV